MGERCVDGKSLDSRKAIDRLKWEMKTARLSY